MLSTNVRVFEWRSNFARTSYICIYVYMYLGSDAYGPRAENSDAPRSLHGVNASLRANHFPNHCLSVTHDTPLPVQTFKRLRPPRRRLSILALTLSHLFCYPSALVDVEPCKYSISLGLYSPFTCYFSILIIVPSAFAWFHQSSLPFQPQHSSNLLVATVLSLI